MSLLTASEGSWVEGKEILRFYFFFFFSFSHYLNSELLPSSFPSNCLVSPHPFFVPTDPPPPPFPRALPPPADASLAVNKP